MFSQILIKVVSTGKLKPFSSTARTVFHVLSAMKDLRKSNVFSVITAIDSFIQLALMRFFSEFLPLRILGDAETAHDVKTVYLESNQHQMLTK